jgi:hypothetical protein
MFKPGDLDFLAKGKGGVPAAIKHLHNLIKKGGYDYVVTADVRNYFGSAIKKKVGELLPLPEKVVNNVLVIQDDVKVVVKPGQADNAKGQQLSTHYPPTSLQIDEAVRRGVPQGSSASGIIMYWAVLRPLLSALSFADRIVQVGDDLAIPVKDMSEAAAVLLALKSLYATSPVGLLTIGRSETRHIKAGFDFAGYRTTLKRKWVNVVDQTTGVVIEQPGPEWHLKSNPSPKSFRKMERTAAKKYLEAGGGIPGWKQVFLYVKRWLAAFSLWKPTYEAKVNIWLELRAGTWH